jgi:DNA-binding Lrp family transcriptional regulator
MKMQSDLTRQFLGQGYRAELDGMDLVSPDGREVYDIKFGGRGVRDLRDAALRLATFVARHPEVKRGYLLTALIRISPTRARSEWDLIRQVLLPKLTARMQLVALVDGVEVVEPPNPTLTPVVARFLEFARSQVARSGSRTSGSSVAQEDNLRASSPAAVMWKHLEIEKVLLHRWLLGEGPIPVGMLSKQVGCSYPTVLQAIQRLSADGLIERGRGRAVALARYPRDRWPELFRAQRLTYPPIEFVDPTSAPGAVDDILRRLQRLHPKGAALGGVTAARRWDPMFDLNGTPRIDVLLHRPVTRAPHGAERVRDADEFVRRLDPALKRRSPHVRGSTALVVHHIYRHEPLFLNLPDTPIPWADPVEVLFHLNDLGLTAQAGQLLRRLRPDTKSPDTKS